jgi:hypothetical protein
VAVADKAVVQEVLDASGKRPGWTMSPPSSRMPKTLAYPEKPPLPCASGFEFTLPGLVEQWESLSARRSSAQWAKGLVGPSVIWNVVCVTLR